MHELCVREPTLESWIEVCHIAIDLGHMFAKSALAEELITIWAAICSAFAAGSPEYSIGGVAIGAYAAAGGAAGHGRHDGGRHDGVIDIIMKKKINFFDWSGIRTHEA